MNRDRFTDEQIIGILKELESTYYGAMARYLRLPFITAIDPGAVTDIPGLDTQLQRPNQDRIDHRHKAPQVAVVPEAIRLAGLKAALLAMPQFAKNLATRPVASIGLSLRLAPTVGIQIFCAGISRFPVRGIWFER